MDAKAVILEHGRLTARPGPDLYLYKFQSSGGGPWPEIGRRGFFAAGPDRFPARLTDRRGPVMEICLKADRVLGPRLDGAFKPAEAPAGSGLVIPKDLDLPPGAGLFLDPEDGWVMSAAEAAGLRASAFEPEFWPTVPRDELPAVVSEAGFVFIWRQRPDPAVDLAASLAGHFQEKGFSLLVLGDAPADLEGLADLPGAVLAGEAGPDSPLKSISIYARAEEAAEARDREQAGLRGRLTCLQSEEAGFKARLALWDDLDELERKFQELDLRVTSRRQHWGQARRELDDARQEWEAARREREKSGRGLLSWFRSSPPESPAVRKEEERRRSLETVEAAMLDIRQEEEATLAEARRLEKRLAQARLDSENWSSRAALAGDLERLAAERDRTAAEIAALDARPRPRPADFLEGAGLILALAGDLAAADSPLARRRFDVLQLHLSRPPDQAGREALAALALKSKKHFLIIGDFTFWPVWSGRAPSRPAPGTGPAWRGLIVAEEADRFKLYLAEGGLFLGRTPPPGGPAPARLELGSGPGESGAVGLALRAVGEMGPANPVSALTAARAALNFTLKKAGPDGPAVIILSPSPAQAYLIRLMLKDLGAPDGRIFSGEPQDFIHWPKAPLVILEPAFEAPHLSHPWAWPSFGRQRLAWAWNLARDQVWLLGRDAWMKRLPAAAPLAALWGLTRDRAAEADQSDPGRESTPTFWEALDKAKSEVWALTPALESFWWRPLEAHFLAAARRRVKVSLLCAPPGPETDRDYASAAVRALGAYGCSVQLASGFPGFTALVDGRHFSWGHFRPGGQGPQLWGGLTSAVLPAAGPEIGEILQMKLINEKMGRRGGGLKTCRQCGWPLVLINQEQSRGFSDEQPLKLGCLGGCRSGKPPRRLDERELFLSPPKCSQDKVTPYQRVWQGRREFWVCPRHPDGEGCPSYRVLPGDAR
ncbi:MAG: hypothetical protein LBP33_09810 [Candidatus Adiutrix sp.]|nr:hypothetical protein [Candidatus Adiutrix sp.]